MRTAKLAARKETVVKKFIAKAKSIFRPPRKTRTILEMKVGFAYFYATLPVDMEPTPEGIRVMSAGRRRQRTLHTYHLSASTHDAEDVFKVKL